MKKLTTNMDDTKYRKIAIEEAKKAIAFTAHKTTDTPTDALNVVNRKFVTSHTTTGTRPGNPVTGQFNFDTTLGIPTWWNGSNWVDADGNTV